MDLTLPLDYAAIERILPHRFPFLLVDRVLEIEIGTRAGEADSAPTTLLAELMGKHSNLILVSPTGTILESAKRVSHKINRFREILPGLPYLAIYRLRNEAVEVLRILHRAQNWP